MCLDYKCCQTINFHPNDDKWEQMIAVRAKCIKFCKNVRENITLQYQI